MPIDYHALTLRADITYIMTTKLHVGYICAPVIIMSDGLTSQSRGGTRNGEYRAHSLSAPSKLSNYLSRVVVCLELCKNAS